MSNDFNMTPLDMVSNVAFTPSVAPAAQTADATGTAVSLENYNSNVVIIVPGTITDGTHTPKLQHSADGTTNWIDVVAGDIEGTLANLATNTVQKVQYKGTYNWIRVFVTVAGATTGGVYGAHVLLGDARHQPAGQGSSIYID